MKLRQAFFIGIYCFLMTSVKFALALPLVLLHACLLNTVPSDPSFSLSALTAWALRVKCSGSRQILKNKIYPSPLEHFPPLKGIRAAIWWSTSVGNNSSFIIGSLWHCYTLHTSLSPFPGICYKGMILPGRACNVPFSLMTLGRLKGEK